ncbi:MAG TPA: hypothetical protein PL141_11800 [Thermoflexales bacterium]|nr:hypothetical protein [Thermoflexales bacterium]HQW35507.1 hypothetical protein [Thermoflexales bacterium]
MGKVFFGDDLLYQRGVFGVVRIKDGFYFCGAGGVIGRGQLLQERTFALEFDGAGFGPARLGDEVAAIHQHVANHLADAGFIPLLWHTRAVVIANAAAV